MGNPSGQMSGGPMGGMGHMGPGNMMQGYQGWGSTPQTGGYPGNTSKSCNFYFQMTSLFISTSFLFLKCIFGCLS